MPVLSLPRSLAVGLAAVTVFGGLATSAAHAAAAQKFQTHEQAAAQLKKAGITWSSTGNCSDRRKRNCTSFTGINKATIAGVIAFKKASKCPVRLTGGTEVGHAPGARSHANGYKVDIQPAPCVSRYITKHFKYVGTRGDGARQYRSSADNTYAREGSHWDVTYLHSRP